MSVVTPPGAGKRDDKGYARAGGIAARAIAAIFGGYGVATLCSIALAMALPMNRADAVLTGMMAGLAVHAAAAIGVFAASSAARAWAGLVVAAVPLAVLAALGHWHATGRVLP